MINYEDIYILYDHIIDDFCKNIIIKNNITTLNDIFFLYEESFLNGIFSKQTSTKFLKMEYDYKDIKYNLDNEYLSDYMDYDDNYQDYIGIYVFNGDGVCRHVNSLFKDIINKLNQIDSNTYFFSAETDSSKYKNLHMVCNVYYLNETLELDPYLNRFDFDDILLFKNNNLYTKLEDQLQEFRSKHLKEYELISSILHKKFDKTFYTEFTRKIFMLTKPNKNRSK